MAQRQIVLLSILGISALLVLLAIFIFIKAYLNRKKAVAYKLPNLDVKVAHKASKKVKIKRVKNKELNNINLGEPNDPLKVIQELQKLKMEKVVIPKKLPEIIEETKKEIKLENFENENYRLADKLIYSDEGD